METAAAITNEDTNESDLDFSQALSRATLYSALAVGFRVLDKEGTDRILSKKGIDILALAAGIVDDTAALAATALSLSKTAGSSIASLTTSHQRIFGHTARGPVCPYETEYGAEALFQQPQQLGDLAGFYKAFGLTLNTSQHERLDHVSCECEFMAFLALKEAYAIEHDDPGMLEDTRKAARLFLRDHLGRFGLAFARRLAREDQGGFYGTLGDLCFAFLNLECNRVGLAAGPLDLSLRPATDDRVPMACGSGAECTAMPGASLVGEE